VIAPSHFGSPGSGPGQFNAPMAICTANDRIYVCDSSNHRIQMFDREGTYINQFGSKQLRNPRDMCFHDDLLYVCDYGNSKIVVFDPNGSEVIMPFKASKYGLYNPYNIYVFRNTFYVCDGRNIYMFDENKKYMGILQPGYSGLLTRMCGLGNYLYLCDTSFNRVIIYDCVSKKQVRDLASISEFRQPTGILSHDNHIYVCDSGNKRIQIFDSEGTYVGVLGSNLDNPTDLCYYDKHFYVCDAGNNNIRIFTKPNITTGTKS
jgi:DNA-binding beta-propeller fold protein YncE